MALTDYSNFVTVAGNYLGRTDLNTTQMPDFITMAQYRMTRDLRVTEMLKVVTTDTTSGDGKVALPNDFLETKEVHIQGNPPITLEYQSPDLFFRNKQSTTSGKPYYFTIVDQEIQLAPKSDSTRTVEMLYYAKPDFISASTSSNIYLANFPDALLYATLTEAETYLMNDNRVTTWSALYDRAIANIMKNDRSKQYPNTTLNVTTR
jgi:hypothetical protein